MAEHQSRNQGDPKPFDHDVHLIKEIKDALLRETESAGIDIKVSAEDGAVRLSGVVDVLSHKRAAEEIVRRIPGVRHLDNDLTVANEETFTDKDLLDAVSRKLAKRGEGRGLSCQVHKGVVTLYGDADSQEDVTKAVRMVEQMAGVREVRLGKVRTGVGREDDDADASRAAERLIEQLGYDPTMFQVYCDAGTLFVKGFVPASEDRGRLKTALRRLPGVAKVEATLVTDKEMGGEIH